MIADLTQEVNALGVARRSDRQVEQKIKDEIKILKKYGSALMKERRKTGGGRVSLPRLSEPQRRAFAALQERPRIVGLKEGVEVGQRAAKRRRLEPHSPTSSPSPSYSQALSPSGSQERESGREGSASTQGMQSARSEILRQELENQQLKKELMNKKLLLADLQIEYWTKKVQSFK
ncbi:hypothetical protein V3C99_003729 [Haemonchus contortus]|uniref:Protein Shroom1 n=1 Tax=Haemonchus contortus TaxID=6289 RepID=A0A7I4XUU5_HAECO